MTFGAQLGPARKAPPDLLRLDLCQIDEHGITTTGPVGVLLEADEQRLLAMLLARQKRRRVAP